MVHTIKIEEFCGRFRSNDKLSCVNDTIIDDEPIYHEEEPRLYDIEIDDTDYIYPGFFFQ